MAVPFRLFLNGSTLNERLHGHHISIINFQLVIINTECVDEGVRRLQNIAQRRAADAFIQHLVLEYLQWGFMGSASFLLRRIWRNHTLKREGRKDDCPGLDWRCPQRRTGQSLWRLFRSCARVYITDDVGNGTWRHIIIFSLSYDHPCYRMLLARNESLDDEIKGGFNVNFHKYTTRGTLGHMNWH